MALQKSEVLYSAMVKPQSFLAEIAFLMLTIPPLVAQSSANSNPLPSSAPDPAISAALRDVSAKRIEQTIEKLVTFYTRQTLSSDMPVSSGKGATAAADWIKSEFEQYSEDCGGCLEVKTDEFTQEPGPRVPKPTKL